MDPRTAAGCRRSNFCVYFSLREDLGSDPNDRLLHGQEVVSSKLAAAVAAQVEEEMETEEQTEAVLQVASAELPRSHPTGRAGSQSLGF